eukprot:TRINITY_DN24467_c0_g1_i1.p1 TRINITY_DN24467_c0_g1~~TRINITY_DN24467_c0_g1_i1.p1  ORF type:complete len:355 (-),score=27.54 TRINITY_DN24467_c0_g1_i1:316-1380(-)
MAPVKRVRFDVPAQSFCTTTPYSEIYGDHPRDFTFGRSVRKEYIGHKALMSQMFTEAYGRSLLPPRIQAWIAVYAWSREQPRISTIRLGKTLQDEGNRYPHVAERLFKAMKLFDPAFVLGDHRGDSTDTEDLIGADREADGYQRDVHGLVSDWYHSCHLEVTSTVRIDNVLDMIQTTAEYVLISNLTDACQIFVMLENPATTIAIRRQAGILILSVNLFHQSSAMRWLGNTRDDTKALMLLDAGGAARSCTGRPACGVRGRAKHYFCMRMRIPLRVRCPSSVNSESGFDLHRANVSLHRLVFNTLTDVKMLSSRPASSCMREDPLGLALSCLECTRGVEEISMRTASGRTRQKY